MINIDWQTIYYITATLSMVVIIIALIWVMRILFFISKLISNLVRTAQRLGNGIEDIKDLSKKTTLGILGKIINMLEKGGENE